MLIDISELWLTANRYRFGFCFGSTHLVISSISIYKYSCNSSSLVVVQISLLFEIDQDCLELYGKVDETHRIIGLA